MISYFAVLEGGFLSTVQDRGRHGYRQFGMPSAGPADEYAYRAANLLVDNLHGEAALEITINGPKLYFKDAALIALTGGSIEIFINNQPVSMWESIYVPPGSTISTGMVTAGCRSYLAISGGIEVPELLESRSTFLKCSLGGYQGRALKKGDELVYPAYMTEPGLIVHKRIDGAAIPEYPENQAVRVLPGPQDQYFPKGSKNIFYNSEFVLSHQFDRVGCRLEGPVIKHTGSSDIISEGMLPGSIQVPGHGQPIIMMADGPTAGGYPKIATVIEPDLSKLAQLKPGSKISFKQVSLERAYKILADYRKNPDTFKCPAQDIDASCFKGAYSVEIEGRQFKVVIKSS